MNNISVGTKEEVCENTYSSYHKWQVPGLHVLNNHNDLLTVVYPDINKTISRL